MGRALRLGTSVYEHVIDRAHIGPGTAVLDCGCGAGRFVGLATGRGAAVAGIDASGELAEIAATRGPAVDVRIGAFLSAGATTLAIRHSGRLRSNGPARGVYRITGDRGRVILPGWFRVIQTG